MDEGSVHGGPRRRVMCICIAGQQELTQHCKALYSSKVKKTKHRVLFYKRMGNCVQKQH